VAAQVVASRVVLSSTELVSYSLVYSNAYIFTNAVVIVFILCSYPVYSTSSFVFCFQFDLVVAPSCVVYVICFSGSIPGETRFSE
jgi:hypothetical protein